MKDEDDERTEEEETEDDNDNDEIMTETTHGVGNDRNNENNAHGCGDDGGGCLQYATGDDGVCISFCASQIASCRVCRRGTFNEDALTMHPLPRRSWFFINVSLRDRGSRYPDHQQWVC